MVFWFYLYSALMLSFKERSFTVEWSEWQDLDSGVSNYFWQIYKLTEHGDSLFPDPLLNGTWSPGQPYPQYFSKQDGMFAATITVRVCIYL